MKKRKIEKIIFSIMKLLPLIMILIYFALNLSNIWSTGSVLSNNIIIDTFNEILANFSVNTAIAEPIDYFLTEAFGLNSIISTSISYYIVWLIITELLYILYDFIIFLPRAMRSFIERGMN